MGDRQRYGFGAFTLDPSERRLSRNDVSIPLAPKAFDILVALVRNAGHLMSTRELLQLVWPEAFVEAGIVAVHVSALRKALGKETRHYIETVSRSGYRFTGPVTELPAASALTWSIAVLPARLFTTEALPGRDRYFGLTLAEALMDQLGAFSQIIVRPARAIRSYDSFSGDAAAIGRSLLVDAVVESQFLPLEDRIHISLHLIRSRGGELLWNGNYEPPASYITAFAAEAASSIALCLGMLPVPVRSIPRAASRPEVYQLYGRGRFHLLSGSMFEVEDAIAAFCEAIEVDPEYAPAHAGLAMACCARAEFRIAPPHKAYAQAKTAALRALAMEESCADAQAALATVLFLGEWDWVAAQRTLQRALELNPNHTEAYLLYGRLLEATGKLEEALQMKLRALERDPFSPLVHLQISLSYWNQRNYDSAIVWVRKALDVDPRHPHAREHLAGAYLMKGDCDRHMEEILRHAELHGCPEPAMEPLKRAYATGGRQAVVRYVLDQFGNQEGANNIMLAVHYAEAGEMDGAFRNLEMAIDARDPALVHLAVAPQWDPLRADPRFNHCLSRVGLM